MFFIMGISQGQKQLSFVQTVICKVCGKYGRYEVFMTYSYFSLFFIPILKWGRKYIVRSSCCGATYELNPEKGKIIASGADVEILESDLKPMETGQYRSRCGNCGYPLEREFAYCPKCGKKL